MIPETDLQNVTRALQYLAGVCDFAAAQDGVGFNKFDAQFGHSLADQSLIKPLTQGQFLMALKMLQKYQRQLASIGITLPARIEPEPVKVKIVISDIVRIYFDPKPTPDQLALVRALPTRKWNSTLPGTPWECPLDLAEIAKTRFPEATVEGTIPTQNLDDVQIVVPDANGQGYTIYPKPQPAPLFRGSVRIENDQLVLQFKYDAALVDKIRAISDRKYNKDNKTWTVPLKLASEIVEKFPEFEVAPEVYTHIEKLAELTVKSRAETTDFRVQMKGGTPYPFQYAGIEFSELSNGRCIIADEMGLGKTIQALGYLQLHPELRPAYIISPASMKTTWEYEARKWLRTSDTIEMVRGTKPYPTLGTILILNYDILSAWKETIQGKAKVIIADEAHFCKNRKSQRTQALKAISKSAPHILMLTGTPVTNRPLELYTLLNILDPKNWGNFWGYATRYCGAHNNGYGVDFTGATNLEELHEVIKPFVIRRTKAQVLKELPPKQMSTVVVEFDETQRQAYHEYIIHALEGTSQAVQLAEIEKAKQAAALGKLDAAVDWIRDFIETDGKLVVFCTHHMIIDRLIQEFEKVCVVVDGRTKQDDRLNIVNRFQNDPEIKLFIGNIKAAGVGLTLTASSSVAFLEFPWTPGDHSQASDRCHRIGQKDTVTVYNLIAKDTIDEDIVEILESKRQVVEMIHDGKVTDQSFETEGEMLSTLMTRLREREQK